MKLAFEVENANQAAPSICVRASHLLKGCRPVCVVGSLLIGPTQFGKMTCPDVYGLLLVCKHFAQ